MNPILFLDFDGVTHPQGCRTEDLFCQMPLIEGILFQHPAVQVVISSSWREYQALQALRRHFNGALRDRVVGCTPLAHQNPCEPSMRHVREIECTSWLSINRPEVLVSGLWLALDDVPQLFTHNCKQLLQTDPRTGFLQSDANQLDARLLMWSK